MLFAFEPYVLFIFYLSSSNWVAAYWEIAAHSAYDMCNRLITWLGSSVVECSHGKRETLG